MGPGAPDRAAPSVAADEAARRDLIFLLADDDPRVRWAAAERIESLGPGMLPELRKAVRDPDPERAEQARRLVAVLTRAEIVAAFAELGKLPPGKIDLEAAMFLICRIDRPALDPAVYRRKLDDLAGRVRRIMGDKKDATSAAFALRHAIIDREGIKGDPLATGTVEFHRPEHSQITHALDRKTGLPLTLSAVFMFVGKRAGLNMAGVGAPGRFLCKIAADDPEEDMFLDAFEGQSFRRSEFRRNGGNEDDLAETAPKDILRRVLNNLVTAANTTRDAELLALVAELRRALDPLPGG